MVAVIIKLALLFCPFGAGCALWLSTWLFPYYYYYYSDKVFSIDVFSRNVHCMCLGEYILNKRWLGFMALFLFYQDYIVVLSLCFNWTENCLMYSWKNVHLVINVVILKSFIMMWWFEGNYWVWIEIIRSNVIDYLKKGLCRRRRIEASNVNSVKCIISHQSAVLSGYISYKQVKCYFYFNNYITTMWKT